MKNSITIEGNGYIYIEPYALVSLILQQPPQGCRGSSKPHIATHRVGISVNEFDFTSHAVDINSLFPGLRILKILTLCSYRS